MSSDAFYWVSVQPIIDLIGVEHDRLCLVVNVKDADLLTPQFMKLSWRSVISEALHDPGCSYQSVI